MAIEAPSHEDRATQQAGSDPADDLPAADDATVKPSPFGDHARLPPLDRPQRQRGDRPPGGQSPRRSPPR